MHALHSSADKTVRQTFKRDPGAGWKLWCEQTSSRTVSLEIHNPYSRHCWSHVAPGVRERIDTFSLVKASPNSFRTRLEEALRAACTEAGGLSLLNLVWRLAEDPKTYAGSPADFLETLDALLAVAASVRESGPLGEDRSVSALLHQILCGELPWTLSCLFPDLKATRAATGNAKEVLDAGLIDLLDGGGLPHASQLGLLRPLLSCWTRCLDIGVRVEQLPWKNAAQKQYEWCVRQTLRLMRKNGTAVLSPPGDVVLSENRSGKKADPHVGAFSDMMKTALALDRDPNDIEIALVMFPGLRTFGERRREEVDVRTLPQESYFSDWSGMAVLKSGWEHDDASLTVVYDGADSPARRTGPVPDVAPFGGWTDAAVVAELNARSQTLSSGPWRTSIRFDDQPVEPDASRKKNRVGCALTPPEIERHWNVVCEEIETAYDYLELECALSHHLRLQRHFLLMHDEELLLVADAVLPEDVDSHRSTHAGMIEYELSFPLGNTVHSDCGKHGKRETELLLIGPPVPYGTKEVPLARILPLALPEWKSVEIVDSQNRATGRVGGTLDVENGCLVHRLWAKGSGLFAPLVFDLSPARMKQPYTWRQLTVGENLQGVPRDLAAGFRLQFGKNHYLLYRSMTSTANRSVLGHNLVSDLLFARFTPAGQVEPILEVVKEEEYTGSH